MAEWTPERVERFRELAASHEKIDVIAASLGTSRGSLYRVAGAYGIQLLKLNRMPAAVAPTLRERWIAILPKLKEGLRRDLENNI